MYLEFELWIMQWDLYLSMHAYFLGSTASCDSKSRDKHPDWLRERSTSHRSHYSSHYHSCCSRQYRYTGRESSHFSGDGWVGHPLDPIGCLFDTLLAASRASDESSQTQSSQGNTLSWKFVFVDTLDRSLVRLL